MESGDGASVKAANPSEKSSSAPSSVALDTRSSLAFDLLRGAFSRRGGALMGPGMSWKIKIMIFSENIAKFTMFFDKFPKIISLASGCNQKSYYINPSAAHPDSGRKKFSGRRAFARNCPHSGARGDGWPAPVSGDKAASGMERFAREVSPRSRAHGAALRLFGKNAMMNRPSGGEKPDSFIIETEE